jgi:hypothetical protein
MPTNYESYEFNTHVFVVKIWLEEFDRNHKGIWRGYVTHALSGERQYIDGFLDLISFIIPYLIKMRAKINWFWRLGKFFGHKRRKNKPAPPNPMSEEHDHRSVS